MVSRHAARQSNVVWGGIKLCFRGNSQWQVTTVSQKVPSPHRDSLGCGVERKQPCKSTSDQSKWHINNLASPQKHCSFLLASNWGVGSFSCKVLWWNDKLAKSNQFRCRGQWSLSLAEIIVSTIISYINYKNINVSGIKAENRELL